MATATPTAAGLPAGPEAPAFSEVQRRHKGYDKQVVDAFLARARAAFEHSNDPTALTSSQIRTAAFPLVAHGYNVEQVDAAMSRIENAFAAREREQALSQAGARAWVRSSRTLAQDVLDRLSRPAKNRFARVGFLHFGYRIREVDLISDRIAHYLESGEALTVDQVRGVAFTMQRRGYSEAQVDAVLDAVVEVVLAVG